MKRLILLFIFSSFILAGFAVRPGNISWDQDTSDLNENNRYELNIYPNPVETGKVTLEMNSGEISEIRLIDIAGKEVLQRKVEFGNSKYLLPLNEIRNGIYFVRVKTSENKVVVKKLVVSTR